MKDKKGAKKETKQLSKSELVKRLEKTAWTFVKTVVDTAPNPFLILDSKLRVTAANKFFYRTFQVLPKETENCLIYNLGGGQWKIPKLRRALEEILPQKTYFRNFKVEHNFPKIGRKIMLLNARQIYEQIGVPKIVSTPMILLVIEDITNLRKSQEKAILAERAIKEVRTKLEQQKEIDKMKSEFVSLASHQLRTPLTTINWYAELLLKEKTGNWTEAQNKYLKELYRGGKRMVDLVNDLLTTSSIETGTLKIIPKPIKIAELVDSLVDDLLPKINEKEIKFTKKYDEHLLIIKVDPMLIRETIQNLLSNAIKYTPPKGKVSVSIKKIKKDLLIKVADTGYGIPKDQYPKIFTKMFRGRNILDKEPDGTGLGLYIAKYITEQSGGKIWFKSEENKGTTFYLLIPLAKVEKNNK